MIPGAVRGLMAGLLVLLSVGCVSDLVVRPRPAMTQQERDAARERLVGQWRGATDADGEVHELELLVDDQMLAVRVDAHWQEARAWTPTASVGDALVVVVVHDGALHEAVARFEDDDVLRFDFVSGLRLHRVAQDR